MAKQEELSNAIQSIPSKPKGLRELIEESSKELARALPSHLTAERMVRIALTNIRLVPKLAQCTPESFLGSLFVLAQLGLEPVAGRAYLLPFKNKRKIGTNWIDVMEVQAIVGYKGLIDLFYRHESALSIDMQTVHTNDDFSYQYGTDSFLKHKPAMENRGDVIGYYAVAKMRGGASVFRFMSRTDAFEHGKRHSKTWDKQSQSFDQYSPWTKEPDSMCMKTVLIQLCKLIPLSIEMQRAISADETTREYRKGIENALDLPDVTNWNEEESLAVDARLAEEEQKAKP